MSRAASTSPVAAPKTELEAIVLFKPFVVQQATRMSASGVQFDDLVQEGMLAVAKAFATWKIDGGANFLTWIRRPVRFAMLTIVQKHERAGLTGSKKPVKSTHHVSLDEPLEGRPGNNGPRNARRGGAVDSEIQSLHDKIGACDPERDVLASARLPAALTALSRQERRVIRGRFVDDLTLKAIGDLLGLSRERVRQIEGEALIKLRASVKGSSGGRS